VVVIVVVVVVVVLVVVVVVYSSRNISYCVILSNEKNLFGLGKDSTFNYGNIQT